MIQIINKYYNQTKSDLLAIWRDRTKSPQPEKPNPESSVLQDYLCYQEYDHAAGIFYNRKTAGFILRVSIFSGIDIGTIHSLTQLISYEIPHDCCVQVMNFASPKIGEIIDVWHEANVKSGIYESLSNKRKEFYEKGAWRGLFGSEFILRDFQLYLCFSFEKKAGTSNKRELAYRIDLLREKLLKSIRNTGHYVSNIKDTELVQLLRNILTPSTSTYNSSASGLVSNPFRKTQTAEMHEDGVIINSTSNNGDNDSNVASTKFKYLIFEVDEWPSAWRIQDSINYVGDFETGRGLNFVFYMTFGFRLEDQRVSERRATQMRLLKTNQASSKLLSFFPAMMEEIEDWRLVSEAISGGARLAKVVMHIVACIPIANTEETDQSTNVEKVNDTKEHEQQMLDHFFRLGFKLNQVKYDTLNTLITTLPFGLLESWPAVNKQKVPSTMLTSSCATLLPIFGDTQNYSSPMLMLVGKRGQVFFFDPFAGNENGNYNMVVVGKSGSGKSVFLQEYMFSMLRQNGQVVVIDDGRSFKNSTTLLGGDFVDIQGASLCINPFSLYEYGEGALKDDKFKADFEEPLIDLTVSILCIVANIDKNNTKSFDIGFYRNLLKKAVQIVIEKYGSEAGFKEVSMELEKNSELRNSETIKIADQLVFVLKEYAYGRYSNYFNGKATLSINNRLTVFELSSLESNEILQTSVLLTVVFLVYVKTQGRESRTSLIIDEGWRLVKHDAIKGPIEGAARRFRKNNGNLIVATQSISDFDEKNSAAAAAVLSQSDWRILLSAEPKDEKVLKEQLGMDQGEINIATKLRGDKGRYSEFMIRHSSGGWCIARMVIDPFSVKLYSSKAEDVIQIKKLQAQGLSLEESIEKMMKA